MDSLNQFPWAHLIGLITASGYFLGKLAIYRNSKGISVGDAKTLLRSHEGRIIRRVEKMFQERGI